MYSHLRFNVGRVLVLNDPAAWVHYVPVAADLSDLPERYLWAGAYIRPHLSSK
jgi:hypothetical protein